MVPFEVYSDMTHLVVSWDSKIVVSSTNKALGEGYDYARVHKNKSLDYHTQVESNVIDASTTHRLNADIALNLQHIWLQTANRRQQLLKHVSLEWKQALECPK